MPTTHRIQFYRFGPDIDTMADEHLTPVMLDVVDANDDGVISPAYSTGSEDTIFGSWIAKIFVDSTVTVEVEGQQQTIVGVFLLTANPSGSSMYFTPTDGTILRGAKPVSVGIRGRSTAQFLSLDSLTQSYLAADKSTGRIFDYI